MAGITGVIRNPEPKKDASTSIDIPSETLSIYTSDPYIPLPPPPKPKPSPGGGTHLPLGDSGEDINLLPEPEPKPQKPIPITRTKPKVKYLFRKPTHDFITRKKKEENPFFISKRYKYGKASRNFLSLSPLIRESYSQRNIGIGKISAKPFSISRGSLFKGSFSSSLGIKKGILSSSSLFKPTISFNKKRKMKGGRKKK